MSIISIKINGQSESINLEEITIGQIVSIETNKSLFSNGQYSNLINSGLITQNMALDIIDIYSCYSILIPEFNKKIIGVDNFLSLKPSEVKQIIRDFKKEFLPKYLDLIRQLRAEDGE